MNNPINKVINHYDEEIRLPDEVKRERLVQDNRSEFDKQMDEALYLSLQEIKQQEEISQNYEEEIIKNFYNELQKRKDSFGNLLMDLNKLIKFDKDIKEIYEIIEPIIDSYCNQYIEVVELDSITYEKIFKVIGTVRTDKKNIKLLKTILLSI
jgi:CHASE3 domain sensor protein